MPSQPRCLLPKEGSFKQCWKQRDNHSQPGLPTHLWTPNLFQKGLCLVRFFFFFPYHSSDTLQSLKVLVLWSKDYSENVVKISSIKVHICICKKIFFKKILNNYFPLFGCARSLLLPRAFPVVASKGFSCRGAWAGNTWAQ